MTDIQPIEIHPIYESIKKEHDEFRQCYYHAGKCDCCMGCVTLQRNLMDTIHLFEKQVKQYYPHIFVYLSGTGGHVVLDDYNWDLADWCVGECNKQIKEHEQRKELTLISNIKKECEDNILQNKYAIQFLEWLNSDYLICEFCEAHITT